MIWITRALGLLLAFAGGVMLFLAAQFALYYGLLLLAGSFDPFGWLFVLVNMCFGFGFAKLGLVMCRY